MDLKSSIQKQVNSFNASQEKQDLVNTAHVIGDGLIHVAKCMFVSGAAMIFAAGLYYTFTPNKKIIENLQAFEAEKIQE